MAIWRKFMTWTRREQGPAARMAAAASRVPITVFPKPPRLCRTPPSEDVEESEAFLRFVNADADVTRLHDELAAALWGNRSSETITRLSTILQLAQSVREAAFDAWTRGGRRFTVIRGGAAAEEHPGEYC